MSEELEPTETGEVPTYDAAPELIQELTSQLLRENTEILPSADEYRYVAIEVPGDSQFANIGRHVERVVFEQKFGNNAQQMTEEYSPYEKASTFFISVDQTTQQATGVLRIIRNSSAGLKSWDDAKDSFRFVEEKAAEKKGLQDLDKIWDVGTIAVLPEHRAKEGAVSILLERAMYLSAMAHDIQALTSIVDHKPLIKMRSTWRGVGIPFKALPGTKPQPYLGSKKSHAVYGFVPEFYEKMSQHRESFRGRMIARYALGDALDRLVEGTADEAIILKSL
ncbi:MAG: hypothetical protein JWN12_236 [Candidatus Saccharibacteria bacterium]|nr:hypothetical protein [Candidatus Saccharibacteria bacterium]